MPQAKTATRRIRRRPSGTGASPALIRKCVNCLLAAAPAGSRVILFGSYARGTAHPDSDLDFFVVEPRVNGRIGEMVRLRRELESVLSDTLLAADVIVVSEQKFRYWRDTPNTLAHTAATEGREYVAIA
ncbi:MAG: nucleotidyltransferase domain-containing protein [Planctomycetota bacterium]